MNEQFTDVTIAVANILSTEAVFLGFYLSSSVAKSLFPGLIFVIHI
jgi:hypothetical protein